ncbi:hypothetical protein [Actinocorallia longicatena]|uniref:hypothetical protein n=1 Tax=Actinocorallia longicatena TaxID=111803 RepID=UPI0031E0523F
MDEAFKLFETVRRRMGDDRGKPGDVWSEAVREERPAGSCPHGCPACRAYEAARSSGPDVVSHVVDAGQSLFAAFQDVLAGYERSRPARPGTSETGGGGAHQEPMDIG